MNKNNTKSKALVVDESSGEILDVYINLTNPYKAKLPKCHIIFANSSRLLDELSIGAHTFYIRLTYLMGKGNYIYLTQTQLSERYKLSKSVVSKYIIELTKQHVIAGISGRYIINPSYALNGGSKYYQSTHTSWQSTHSGQ